MKSVSNSRANAAVVNGLGTRLSGFATASGAVLNAVTSWTVNGYR